MLTVLLTIVHVIVAVFLVMVVLLQTGKRADLAGAFGGGGSQTAFGARGAATLLTKLTTTAAVLFMITSLSLSIVSVRLTADRGTVLTDVAPGETTGAPAPAGETGGQQPAAPAAPDRETGEPAGEMPVESAPTGGAGGNPEQP